MPMICSCQIDSGYIIVFPGGIFLFWCSGLYCLKSVLCCWSSKVLCRSSIVLALLTQACHRLDELLLCPSSSSAWAQVTGASFSVPFFLLSVGTGDRNKLLCTLLLPQRGHRWQGQASLCPSSASAWAQVTGASFSVPFFLLSVNSLWVWVTYFVADTHVRESLRVCEACFAADTHTEKSLRVC